MGCPSTPGAEAGPGQCLGRCGPAQRDAAGQTAESPPTPPVRRQRGRGSLPTLGFQTLRVNLPQTLDPDPQTGGK